MKQPNHIGNRKHLLKLATALAAISACSMWLFSSAAPITVPTESYQDLLAGESIVTVKGSGQRVLHVFVSADCIYCRRLEPELLLVQDVTIHRHLLPGHSHVGRQAASKVWCANDRAKAWLDNALGHSMENLTCSLTPLEENLAKAKLLGLSETPALIFEDGRVRAGMMKAAEIEQELSLKA